MTKAKYKLTSFVGDEQVIPIPVILIGCFSVLQVHVTISASSASCNNEDTILVLGCN